MNKYIGIKIVDAEPMNAQQAIEKGFYRGDNKEDQREGYHVHYLDNDYHSWCPADIFEQNNNFLIDEEFANTSKLMVSSDYKERFIAEYKQTEIRYIKLKNMVSKWDNDQLDFTPTCSREIYSDQLYYMRGYLAVLVERAKVENVDLNINPDIKDELVVEKLSNC